MQLQPLVFRNVRQVNFDHLYSVIDSWPWHVRLSVYIAAPLSSMFTPFRLPGVWKPLSFDTVELLEILQVFFHVILH